MNTKSSFHDALIQLEIFKKKIVAAIKFTGAAVSFKNNFFGGPRRQKGWTESVVPCISKMMMMSSLAKGGSIGFMPSGDDMSEVVSRCLPHRQLWVSNLSRVAMQWLEVDSNLQPSGCKAQNTPLHNRIPYINI